MGTYVTTAQTPAWQTTTRPGLISLIIRLLASLVTAPALNRTSSACCDDPKPEHQGGGWYWCMNCGARWQEDDQAAFHAKLDKSLQSGYDSVNW